MRVCIGVVRGYRIHYAAVSDVGDTLEETRRVLDVDNSSLTATVIADLRSDCVYEFEMNAYTRRTDGQRTRQRRVKTHGAGDVYWSTADGWKIDLISFMSSN